MASLPAYEPQEIRERLDAIGPVPVSKGTECASFLPESQIDKQRSADIRE